MYSSAKKKYFQKFVKSWLRHPDLKDWIQEHEDPKKAYCSKCKCALMAKLSKLQEHALAKKHRFACGIYDSPGSDNDASKSKLSPSSSKKQQAAVKLPAKKRIMDDHFESVVVEAPLLSKRRRQSSPIKAEASPPPEKKVFAAPLNKKEHNLVEYMRKMNVRKGILTKEPATNASFSKIKEHYKGIKLTKNPNAKSAVLYQQKFRQAWKIKPELADWIVEHPSSPYRALCKFCGCSLNTKLNELLNHGNTKKHKKAVATKEVVITAANYEAKHNDDFSNENEEFADEEFLNDHERENVKDSIVLENTTGVDENGETVFNVNVKSLNTTNYNEEADYSAYAPSFVIGDDGKKKYLQKFRQEWKRDPRMKNWVEDMPKEPQKAFCKYCQKPMLAKKSYLLAHFASRKHNKAAAAAGADAFNVFDNLFEDNNGDCSEDDNDAEDNDDDNDDVDDDDDDDDEDEDNELLNNIDNMIKEEEAEADLFAASQEKSVSSRAKKQLNESKENQPAKANVNVRESNKNKCRICLDEYKSEKMVDLFQVDELGPKNVYIAPEDVLKISEKVEYCCGVKLTRKPGYPTKICYKCVDMTRIWFNFRQVCIKSQLYLESKVNAMHCDEEDDAIYMNKLLRNIQNFRSTARNKHVGYDLDVVDSITTENVDKSNLIGEEDYDNNYTENNLHNSSLRDLHVDSDDNDECLNISKPKNPTLVKKEKIETNEEYLSDDGDIFDTHHDDDDDDYVPELSTRQHGVINKKPKASKKAAQYKYRPPSPESYMCTVCGNIYAKRSAYTSHMIIHSDVKPHECELCGKAFRQLSQLTHHMRRHTGEKPYQCRYCERRFFDGSDRIRHERIHTNERNYVCTVCGKSFMYSAILRNHEKLHTGEKKYNCIPCDKAFTLPHQLKSHQLTITHKQKEEMYLASMGHHQIELKLE